MKTEGEDGIFMKIARHEVPADIVYEDEETVAFMDNAPIVPGHVLVIPKAPVRNVFDADERTWSAVMRTVRLIAPIVRDAAGAKSAHINSNHGPEAGQVVFHLHVHIIPRHDRSEFEFWPSKDVSSDESARIAEAIRSKLS